MLVEVELVSVALVDVRLVNAAVRAFNSEANRFVDVELVIVPFVAEIFVSETEPAFRFVIVALVSVAFPAAISAFVKLVVPVAVMFVVEREFSCEV